MYNWKPGKIIFKFRTQHKYLKFILYKYLIHNSKGTFIYGTEITCNEKNKAKKLLIIN